MLPSWLSPGERAVWLRHGVVSIHRLHVSAGESFVVVQPHGWSGDEGWIRAAGFEEQLRPLMGADVCGRWLALLRAAAPPLTPGAHSHRARRQGLAIELGSPEHQATALAAAYGDPCRATAQDLAVIDELERLVVVEIACVLGQDPGALRTELRAARPRFGADATIVDAPPDEPQLGRGWTWLASFDVGERVHVTDLDATTLEVRAVPGTWHAAMSDVGGEREELPARWIAASVAVWPELKLDGAKRRLLARTSGHQATLAIVADEAIDDPLVIEEMRACEAHDLFERGAAMFWRLPTNVYAWDRDGVCIAIEVQEYREAGEVEYDPDPLAWPHPGERVLHIGHGVATIAEVAWDEGKSEYAVAVLPLARPGAKVHLNPHLIENHLRPLISRDDASQILVSLSTPTVSRPAGDVQTRDRRYRDAIDNGTLAEQAAAFANLLADVGDADTLAHLERLVVGELAAVLDLDHIQLAERLRRQHRVAPAPQAPVLPDRYTWILSFDVKESLDITDLSNDTVSLRAVPGRWHAAWREGGVLAVVVDTVRGAPPAGEPSRRWTVAGPRDFALGLLDGGALRSSVVSNVLIEGTQTDVLGRGVAWLGTKEPVCVRVWESDQRCVAVEVSTAE